MGYYKNQATDRQRVRRYNATARRADKLKGEGATRLISLETVSDVEKFSMAQDADRVTDFDNAVEQWQKQVTDELRRTVSTRSTRIGAELQPRAYTDKYGIVNRVGFSFPRHGIYLHYGAGHGQGGWKGSHWEKLKESHGTYIGTGIIKSTAPASINGRMGTGNRNAFPWFDPVVRRHIPELEKIVLDYFDTMIVDASRIYITK